MRRRISGAIKNSPTAADTTWDRDRIWLSGNSGLKAGVNE